MSSIQLSADKVISAYNNLKKHREEVVAKRRDELVKSFMRPKYIWFGRVLTYEEAEIKAKQYTRDGRLFTDWVRISFYMSDIHSKAHDLALLAKHGDPVTITADHAWLLTWLD